MLDLSSAEYTFEACTHEDHGPCSRLASHDALRQPGETLLTALTPADESAVRALIRDAAVDVLLPHLWDARDVVCDGLALTAWSAATRRPELAVISSAARAEFASQMCEALFRPAAPSSISAPPDTDWARTLAAHSALRLDGELYAVLAARVPAGAGAGAYALSVFARNSGNFWLRDAAVDRIMRVFKSGASARPRSISMSIHDEDTATRALLQRHGFVDAALTPLYHPVQKWTYTHPAQSVLRADAIASSGHAPVV
ncbi:hypothetical protein Q5752_006784 [Cryptotrichosporon argae]